MKTSLLLVAIRNEKPLPFDGWLPGKEWEMAVSAIRTVLEAHNAREIIRINSGTYLAGYLAIVDAHDVSSIRYAANETAKAFALVGAQVLEEI